MSKSVDLHQSCKVFILQPFNYVYAKHVTRCHKHSLNHIIKERLEYQIIMDSIYSCRLFYTRFLVKKIITSFVFLITCCLCIVGDRDQWLVSTEKFETDILVLISCWELISLSFNQTTSTTYFYFSYIKK